ncbi:helix-turn-helix domain-containing protein [Lysinibacillus fusiformis]|uniref:helix-turn-helix domain-containing protein n=1 Tax=Lysinibacillus fusiformis TaxID=28031 RepID=UPI0008872768|nr:helix-turn-helix domain-containing protein [Lysinibacillus fusiformis]SCX38295.1 Helix-turn-helix domain-containing protein [Lysinibacillus fusiformis]SDB05839.1 Helix-turn-helix domain-containing protein [Lysinibacillus fusiformis]SFH76040.1 Helix-turn-helix domain-containing protein [Lysinibacillus fusiformis]SFT29885.1 Helix-turn-helix domain-containing protein [Lysinibacillus fusiformis]
MAFEYLAQYITFNSVADMDKSVEDHMSVHYYNLTESERAIVFKLASHSLEHTGVCHLKASTIASSLEISTKTVYRSMKKLTELGIIEKVPSTKLNGIKGASIYRILPYVSSSVSQRETVDEACNNAVCRPQSETQPSSSFYLSSFKTSNLQEVYESAYAEKEARKEYMNEYQVMLFDFMNSLPLADNLKDELHKVVLATQVQNVPDFIKAKNVLFKIAMDIKEGTLTVTSTLRAVFIGAYKKAIGRSKVKPDKSSSIEETPVKERPVPFYNWLNERDRYPQSVGSRTTLDNWLEW